jgi:hypothetical protein
MAASIPPSLRVGAASSEQLFPSRPAGSRKKSARGLAQSKTLREVRRPLENAPASWTAVALHRFRFKVQQIAFPRAGFEEDDDPASVF